MFFALQAFAVLQILTCIKGESNAYKQQENNQWFKDGVNLLRNNLQVQKIKGKAHGVVLFLGDGMSLSTVTAARILDGQLKGKTGEENILSWEYFKHVGLSKTYNTDSQVPDSAGTATAFMSGVKSRKGVINMNENVVRGDCKSSENNELMSLIMMAEQAGLSTGIVTTTRLTHATPSSGYAQSANRDWEYEAKDDCKDIASQLIDFPYGNGLEVALGGGRKNFMLNTQKDPEENLYGKRKSRDLIKEWTNKSTNSVSYKYIWNDTMLRALDPSKVDHLLGLFNRDHLNYEYYRKNDTGGEPSLTEMVAFALKVLQKNSKGYILLVEGGRIDHAHHANRAFHALHEAIELSKAVEQANNMTDPRNTLLIVTSDHSHTFTLGGYQSRGTPIFGFANGIGLDGKKFTSLGYHSGPGAAENKPRRQPTIEDLKNPDFKWPSLIPVSSAKHGGEDVGIYARGVQAHMIRGVVEQNYIFHVMDYALCLSESKMEICKTQGVTVVDGSRRRRSRN